MTTAGFLDRVFAGCDDGLVEVRATPSGACEWTEIGDWSPLGKFVSHHVTRRHDVRVGVATRKDTTSGTAENLRSLSMLCVDIDQTPAIVRTNLETFPFRWALLVNSGLHVHGYLELKEALPLETPAEIHRAASLLRRLSAFVGGDDRAVSPAQAPRLLNTLNFKYGDPRPVTLLEATDVTVNPSELEDFLPAEIVNRKRNEMTIAAGIPNGARNDTLYAFTRALRCRDLPFNIIADAVRLLNDHLCDVPLPSHEIDQLLKHALLQPNRINFVPPTPIPTLVHGNRTRTNEQDPLPSVGDTQISPRHVAPMTAHELVATLRTENAAGILFGQDVFKRAQALELPTRSVQHALRQAGYAPHIRGRGAARRVLWVDRTGGRR